MGLTPNLELSPAQQAVVVHRGGDLQVIACAGSGKTESISRRIASLIAEGVPPESIVAFTFTDRAAAELKDRIVRRVREAMGESFLDRLGPMFVGTIHAYCFRLLQVHVPRYGNFDVLDDHRHAGLLSREYRNLGLSKLGQKHWEPIRDFIRTADVIGNELIQPQDLDGTPVGECYRAYLEMLDRYHFLTFSLIISHAVKALEEPAVFQRVHSPLRHLVVDEYQDINPAQERLIEILSQEPVTLCVVGDDDQSIYQWRGSDVGNILQFKSRRPKSAAVSLDENRRSRPSIVKAADAFARSIPHRLEKSMRFTRESAEPGFVPWSAETDEEEAEFIAETISKLHARGYAYRDIGVLYRSVRTSAPLLIDALKAREIPFSCAGRTGLFLQPEIARFGELFSWLSDGDWRDERFGQSRKADIVTVVHGLEAAFVRSGTIPGLRQYLEDWKAFQLRGSRSVSLVGDFYQLLWTLKAQELEIDTPEGSARFGAFARFSEILADFEHVNRRGRFVEDGGTRSFQGGRDRGKPYFQALANYLLHYARDAYEDFEGEEHAELDAVDVLTVHQAKGLEWPIVFIPALVERRFPSRLTGTAQPWLLPDAVFPAEKRRRYEGSEAEERRLFYVAMTRARDCLYLSTFERKTNRFRPSPFLTEVAGTKLLKQRDLPLPGPPEKPGEKDPPPIEVTFSEVATYEDCGHRYRLGTVMGFQQEIAVPLGYGKAIHHVLRQIAEAARAQGKIPKPDEVQSILDAETYLPFATAQVFEFMRRSISRLVSRYLGEYSSDLKRVWDTERPFELHLGDGIVSGRADIILDEENGKLRSLAIVDYKVAEDKDQDARFELQLAIYAAAGRGEGLIVDAAYLHELKESNRRSVDISAAKVKGGVKKVADLVTGIRRASFEAKPEAKRCGECDFRRICRHGVVGVSGI